MFIIFIGPQRSSHVQISALKNMLWAGVTTLKIVRSTEYESGGILR